VNNSTAAQINVFAALGEPATIAAPTHRVPVRAHSRVIEGPPPATGLALRDAALEKMARREAVKIALPYVREQLVVIYRERVRTGKKRAYVNADDAAGVLEMWAECPPALYQGTHPQHWRGLIFRAKGWQLHGTSSPAIRRHMRGTTLPNWIYVAP
jgi:hypothetical protein